MRQQPKGSDKVIVDSSAYILPKLTRLIVYLAISAVLMIGIMFLIAFVWIVINLIK